jgi:hypothetical protein
MKYNTRFAHRQMRCVPPGWRHPYYRDPAGCDRYLPIAQASMPPADPANRRYQMYETQTSGTPISPMFSTEEDLIRWLIKRKITFIGSCPGTEEDWNGVIRNSPCSLNNNSDIKIQEKGDPNETC